MIFDSLYDQTECISFKQTIQITLKRFFGFFFCLFLQKPMHRDCFTLENEKKNILISCIQQCVLDVWMGEL